jgi:lipopolysaccharide/colanic/teichoic acid biosynthesis glycosyltransferase
MTAKRIFDLIFTVPGLIVLLPFFVLIALWIKLDSKGPVLYRQERVGRHGKTFGIYKFRTMVENADKIGGAITIGNDPRITKVGRFLRKYKIDELPQLINVLKGEMSLVGPRPEVSKYVNLYTSEQREVLNLIPGITDPASIKYRNENILLAASRDTYEASYDPEQVYIQEIMPDKIRINLEYASRATVLTDFKVVIKTIFGK